MTFNPWLLHESFTINDATRAIMHSALETDNHVWNTVKEAIEKAVLSGKLIASFEYRDVKDLKKENPFSDSVNDPFLPDDMKTHCLNVYHDIQELKTVIHEEVILMCVIIERENLVLWLRSQQSYPISFFPNETIEHTSKSKPLDSRERNSPII